jgi:hypothetical protein
MDRVEKYRQIIREYLEDFAKDDSEAQLLFDSERDRYMVIHSAWRGDYRIYGCAIHLDLIDGKVWIQNNSTEVDVDCELIDRGVDPKDIVLGFRSPAFRTKLAELRGY